MSRSASDSIVTPIQFLRLSLEDEIIVECRDNRVIRGVLHSFDEHMNVLLGDTEETITTFVLGENNTKTKEVETKQRPLVFLRGDCIIAVANSFQ